MAFSNGKTADLKKKLAAWSGRVLFVSGGAPDEGFKAARNLWDINILPHQGHNVYDILRHDCLVLEKSAIEHVEGRLSWGTIFQKRYRGPSASRLPYILKSPVVTERSTMGTQEALYIQGGSSSQ